MQRANLGDPDKGAPRQLTYARTLDEVRTKLSKLFACSVNDIAITGEVITIYGERIKTCRIRGTWDGGYVIEVVEPKQLKPRED